MKRLGFLVNPIAGMGGAVGLKGTDGEAYNEALKLGAEPVTPERASRFLSSIKNRDELLIMTAPGVMGENLVKESKIRYRVLGLVDGGGDYFRGGYEENRVSVQFRDEFQC